MMTTYAPRHVDIWPWMTLKPSSSAANQVRSVNTQSLGLGVLSGSGTAAGNHVEWDVALDAGTWTLTVIYWSQSGGGVITPSLNGVDFATYEGYTAGNVRNAVYQATGITITTPGIYEVKLRADTKHASSTGYGIRIHLVTLTRTGA